MSSRRNKAACLALGLVIGLSSAGSQAQTRVPERCGIVAREERLLNRDPFRSQKRLRLNELIRESARRLPSEGGARTGDVIYRIPVVVHVVHRNAAGTVGGPNNPNISDEQIASQIQVLNEDYRRKAGTRGFNTNPIGADTGIEFFLAQADPDGRPTTGITRHYYAQKPNFDVFGDDDLLLSQIAYWPSDRYLNIWVTSLQSDYLGYSQFPTAGSIPGLETEEDERTDGVIIDYRYFGSNTGTVTSSTYRYGRTTTHEVGHWLGLIHTWGDAVCGEDYCADTPPTESANQTTECAEKFSNCAGTRTRNQIENYLDYTPDACMNLFTADQRSRMRSVLEVSPRRQRLLRSVNALPESPNLTVSVYPNPADNETTLQVLLQGFQSVQVAIFDLAGRLVRSQNFQNYPSTAFTLPVETLPPGMYIVKVSTDKEAVSRRLLVY